MKSVVKERIGYIDLFRGVGIIIMVMDHIGAGGIFSKYIHSFHMPMFFFISGYCYNIKGNRDVLAMAKKKSRNLLIPYLFWGILQFGLWYACVGDSFEPLWHLFWINTDGLAIAGALWFLTAIFWTDILYRMIDKLLDGVIQHLVVFFIAILGCLWTTLFEVRLPWGIDVAFVGLGFYHIGKVVKENATRWKLKQLQELKVAWIVLLGLVNSILIIINSSINMRTGRYGNIILFWIDALLSIFLILWMAKRCECKLMPFCREYISGVGQHAIMYVCMNQIVITTMCRVCGRILCDSIIKKVIVILGVFAALWMMEKLVYNTKLKKLFG